MFVKASFSMQDVLFYIIVYSVKHFENCPKYVGHLLHIKGLLKWLNVVAEIIQYKMHFSNKQRFYCDFFSLQKSISQFSLPNDKQDFTFTSIEDKVNSYQLPIHHFI